MDEGIFSKEDNNQKIEDKKYLQSGIYIYI